MRGHMLRRMVCGTLVGLMSYGMVFTKSASSRHLSKSAVTLEDAVVKDALEKFKEAIEKKDGHLDRISYRCKFYNNEPLETALKTYYSDYRKDPDFSVQKHSQDNDVQAEAVIEIVYIPHKDYLSLSHKDGRAKRCLLEKQLEIPSWFNA